MALIIQDHPIQLTDEGFLKYQSDWNEQVAEALARLNDIELTPEHWQILFFIRDYYKTYEHLPNSRVFVKALKKNWGEDIGNSRYLHRLFPQGPLKYACKLAGLPKPPTCL
jgi:tRNA 2-thiouridine synthesizing protein E